MSTHLFTISMIFYICIVDVCPGLLVYDCLNVNVLVFLLHVFKLLSLILVKLPCEGRLHLKNLTCLVNACLHTLQWLCEGPSRGSATSHLFPTQL